jgi:hypothetical protein
MEKMWLTWVLTVALLTKTGARDRAQAVRYAYQHGIA